MKENIQVYNNRINPPYLKHILGATLVLLLFTIVAVFLLPNKFTTKHNPLTHAAGGPALSVNGNHIVDSSGNVVILRGVTRWSLEFNCSDGHFNLSDFQAIRSWGANSVRITLNSNFWLNGYAGNCTNNEYQQTVKDAVTNAEAAGLRPILVLQWTGNQLNGGRGGQDLMPTRDALIFWQQLASFYANDPLVMFTAFAEPHDTPSWDVWLNGDSIHAGMQELVNVISQAAPEHIIFVSGESYAKNLDFVTNGHMVQGTNLVLEVHPYGYFSNYINQWQTLQPNYPIIDGEAGIDSSGDTLDTQLQTFESWQTGYFGWAWTDTDNHSLLNPGGWNGTPRSDPPQFGIRFHDFMLTQSQTNGGFITPTVSPTTSPSGIGDINEDGTVNLQDFSIMLSDWGTSAARSDLSRDGTVSLQDLSILLSHWEQ